MIGTVAGSTAMYGAMTEMGFAQESGYSGPPKLGNPKKAGHVGPDIGFKYHGHGRGAELRDAGYKVQILEYTNRPGGRNWSLYGGDIHTELGGAKQENQVRFRPTF